MPAPSLAPAGVERPGDDDAPPMDPATEAHLRDVFAEYLACRGAQGQRTEGLRFEPFAANLARTRARILARSGATEVRFSVYVKDGKAAIKARPSHR